MLAGTCLTTYMRKSLILKYKKRLKKFNFLNKTYRYTDKNLDKLTRFEKIIRKSRIAKIKNRNKKYFQKIIRNL